MKHEMSNKIKLEKKFFMAILALLDERKQQKHSIFMDILIAVYL